MDISLENPVTAYHIAKRLDAHLNMGSTWHINLDSTGIQLEWPASLSHAITYDKASPISVEVRRVLSAKQAGQRPPNVMELPIVAPEERYSSDDLDAEDEDMEVLFSGNE
jgi:hypothetical protein